jgi:hypothetical protein
MITMKVQLRIGGEFKDLKIWAVNETKAYPITPLLKRLKSDRPQSEKQTGTE